MLTSSHIFFVPDCPAKLFKIIPQNIICIFIFELTALNFHSLFFYVLKIFSGSEVDFLVFLLSLLMFPIVFFICALADGPEDSDVPRG